jgi:hypothetical protein
MAPSPSTAITVASSTTGTAVIDDGVSEVLIRIPVIRYRYDGRESAFEPLKRPILDKPDENSHSNPYDRVVRAELRPDGDGRTSLGIRRPNGYLSWKVVSHR